MSRKPLELAPATPAADSTPMSWLRRVLWFIGLWLVSVALLSVVAMLIRFWLNPSLSRSLSDLSRPGTRIIPASEAVVELAVKYEILRMQRGAEQRDSHENEKGWTHFDGLLLPRWIALVRDGISALRANCRIPRRTLTAEATIRFCLRGSRCDGRLGG